MHVVDLGPVPSMLYGPHNLSGIIPEHRARCKSWVPPEEVQKQNHLKSLICMPDPCMGFTFSWCSVLIWIVSNEFGDCGHCLELQPGPLTRLPIHSLFSKTYCLGLFTAWWQGKTDIPKKACKELMLSVQTSEIIALL